MSLPTTPAAAAAALASPAALDALVAGVKAGARCRDGGAQVKRRERWRKAIALPDGGWFETAAGLPLIPPSHPSF
jgi:hypothetical protein